MMKEHWTLEAAFRKVHAVRREDSFNASFLVKALTAVSNLSLWSSLLFAYCTILHMFAIWCDSLVKILMWSPRSFIDLESQKPRCWVQKKKLNPALGEVPTSDFLWTTPACAGWFVQTGEMADETRNSTSSKRASSQSRASESGSDDDSSTGSLQLFGNEEQEILRCNEFSRIFAVRFRGWRPMCSIMLKWGSKQHKNADECRW